MTQYCACTGKWLLSLIPPSVPEASPWVSAQEQVQQLAAALARRYQVRSLACRQQVMLRGLQHRHALRYAGFPRRLKSAVVSVHTLLGLRDVWKRCSPAVQCELTLRSSDMLCPAETFNAKVLLHAVLNPAGYSYERHPWKSFGDAWFMGVGGRELPVLGAQFSGVSACHA